MLHLLMLLVVAAPAYADESQNEPKVIYKQRTEIDFEGLEIEGTLVKPQGALMLERRRAHFNPLIKLRRDFDDEMDKSVDEIK